MNATPRILLTALFCAAAVGCSKKVKEAPPATNEAVTTPADSGPPAVAGAYTPADLDTDACLQTRVVYFDYDQDTLRPEFQAAMACHAKYLRDRPSARMNLEGNADERGTRNYNLGLGERRGNAVAAALQANGGSASQISVISYGEERPTCSESSEACWARNRRVEIVYSAR